MADSSQKVPPAQPQPEPGGYAGLAASIVTGLNKLTNEKILLVVALSLLVYMTFNTLDKQSQRENYVARAADETRERDRRHCDDREDQLRRAFVEHDRETRAWYAAQADAQRRHDAEREERLRQTWSEGVKAILAKLGAKIGEVIHLSP